MRLIHQVAVRGIRGDSSGYALLRTVIGGISESRDKNRCRSQDDADSEEQALEAIDNGYCVVLL